MLCRFFSTTGAIKSSDGDCFEISFLVLKITLITSEKWRLIVYFLIKTGAYPHFNLSQINVQAM